MKDTKEYFIMFVCASTLWATLSRVMSGAGDKRQIDGWLMHYNRLSGKCLIFNSLDVHSVIAPHHLRVQLRIRLVIGHDV